MNNIKKNVPTEIRTDILEISRSLTSIFAKQDQTYRGVAQRSGLSVNSVKSILKGATANIASYDAVARALGTTLLEVAHAIHDNILQNLDHEVVETTGFQDSQVQE